jgi:hypothetical protein
MQSRLHSRVRLLGIFFAVSCLLASAQMGPGDFTVIALPDTQNYSQYYPQVFNSQTEWIVRNRSALNIKFVVGLGDIVNNGSDLAQQQNADAAVRTLDNAGIPYLLALGNHDYKWARPDTRDAAVFNRFFGPWRYSGKTWYRGNFPAGSNENFYGVFDINGRKYLVMALEFYPRNSVLSWAASVIAANPDRQVILIMHSYLLGDRRVGLCDSGNAEDYGIGFDNDGQEMWAKLMSKHPNIIMVLNGHFHGWGRRADLGVRGNLVNQIEADYQRWTNGGGGYLRIMTFRPLLNRVDVKTYSPYYNHYLTDGGNQFSIPLYNATPGAIGTGSIKGLVRSRSDCRRLAGIRVSTATGSVLTDANGAFSISSGSGVRGVTASGSGWNSSTLNIQVDPGLAAQLDFFLTPTSTSTGGVTVTSPINGATVSPWVHFVATASATRPITYMRVYVDGQSKYGVAANRIDTWLQLSLGWRNIVVQAWDSGGTVYKKALAVNVR